MIIRSKVTGKNQVTIPAAIANKFNIEPGTEIEWVLGEGGSEIVVRPVLSRYELAQQLEGILRDALQPGDDPVGDLIRERVEEDEEHL